MTKEQAIEICNKIIQQNNEIVKQTRLNKDINAMQLTANCDKESLAIKTVLSELKEKDARIEYHQRQKKYDDNFKHELLEEIRCLNLDKDNNSAEIEQKNTELAEKNAEIEKLKKILDEKYIFVAGARTVYARLMSLDKEDIVKDDLKLRNEIYQHIEDNEKKDKIIDLMAEYIARGDIEEDICIEKLDECDSMALGECENCIKQYFEQEATNNG